MKHANDNNLTQAYLDLEKDKDVFKWAMMFAPELVIEIKRLHGKDRERQAANFCWFLKFEMSLKEYEIENRRSKIEIVE